MSEIKLCKDCKWFQGAPDSYTLNQLSAMQGYPGRSNVPSYAELNLCKRRELYTIDLVTGGLLPIAIANCEAKIQRAGECGEEAKFFEPKPAPFPPPVSHFPDRDPCVTLAKPWWKFWR